MTQSYEEIFKEFDMPKKAQLRAVPPQDVKVVKAKTNSKRETLSLQTRIKAMGESERCMALGSVLLCQSHEKGYYWRHEGAEAEAKEKWENHCIEAGINNRPDIYTESPTERMFSILTANGWMAQSMHKPKPTKLFDEFFLTGEVSILFSDTNAGKSVLAVQIAESLASGKAIPGFLLEAKAQKVLYIDCEMSDKQFENRYSTDYHDHYHFSDNFKRAELDPDADMPEGKEWAEFIIDRIREAIIQTDSTVIIIDNLTFLNESLENAKDAAPLMKHLKLLKNEMGVSILILAHTPKRDKFKSMSKNDIQGSRMVLNFADSSFTIGESALDPKIRFLKQIKQRNGAEAYGADNVVVCQISKVDSFTGFTFVGYEAEWKHLKESTVEDRSNAKQKARELSATGKTQRAIASELGVSASNVNKYLKD
jgi:hypothetical protein